VAGAAGWQAVSKIMAMMSSGISLLKRNIFLSLLAGGCTG
jgi:hypothetical protein